MPEWLQIAGLILKISLVLQVFAIGLGARWSDATYLFRRPALLWNSILARSIVAPVIAILLIKALSLRGAVAIALCVLAVTPVPPLMPRSLLKGGCRVEYVLGLLVSHAALAIILLPVTLQAMAWVLRGPGPLQRPSGRSVGRRDHSASHRSWDARGSLPAETQESCPNLLMVGSVLLIAGALPLLPVAWKAFAALSGDGSILALALFMLAGMAVGHFLGGPAPEDRTALAIATSSRHPGLALAIAKVNFPEQGTLIAGAIVIYLLLRVVLAIPYLRWRRNASRLARSPHAPPHLPPGFAGRHR